MQSVFFRPAAIAVGNDRAFLCGCVSKIASGECRIEELNMSNTATSFCPDFATPSGLPTEGRFVSGKSKSKATNPKPPGVLGWYRILRAHHQWSVFQAIRYALWLTR